VNANDADKRNTEPIYNIGMVSRITDIPENTLRTWERRHGFPRASRTEGGHRLYSEFEVARLQWVKTRLDEGIQISQAVRLLRHAEDEGHFSEPAASAPVPSLYDARDTPALERFRGRMLESLFNHDAEGADQVLANIMALYPLESVLFNVISPIFNATGQAWAEGRISIATDHFVTQRLRTYLVSWVQASPPPFPVSPVILAGAPGEWHEGSLLMLAVLLRRLRWPVIYIGQSVPLTDLAEFVDEVNPSVLVLVAITEEPALALQELPHWLPDVQTSTAPIICYGGRIFSLKPDLVDDSPGIYLGDNLQEGVEKLNAILRELHPDYSGRVS